MAKMKHQHHIFAELLIYANQNFLILVLENFITEVLTSVTHRLPTRLHLTINDRITGIDFMVRLNYGKKPLTKVF
jgi:hypothetical protein